MAAIPTMLYGSTNKSGSVPGAARGCHDGPVFSPDGKLILSDSFTALRPAAEAASTLAAFQNDWLVETWGIWDCDAGDWAPCGLTLFRYETADLVVREDDSGNLCAWIGALNTQDRVLASPEPDECRDKCWQWLRLPRPLS